MTYQALPRDNLLGWFVSCLPRRACPSASTTRPGHLVWGLREQQRLLLCGWVVNSTFVRPQLPAPAGSCISLLSLWRDTVRGCFPRTSFYSSWEQIPLSRVPQQMWFNLEFYVETLVSCSIMRLFCFSIWFKDSLILVKASNIVACGKPFLLTDRGENELSIDLAVWDVGIPNQRSPKNTILMPNVHFCFWYQSFFRVFANLGALIMLILVIQIWVFNVLINTEIVNWLQVYSYKS